MSWIKKILPALVIALCLTAAPAFAEDTTTVEVFIDSNALNSTITLMSGDETLSGPGNKVFTYLQAGDTFDVMTEAAEGSAVLSKGLTVKYADGTTGDLAPVSEDGQTAVYQIPDNAVAIAGAVYFGSTEESVDTANTYVQNDIEATLNLEEAAPAAESTVPDEEDADGQASADTEISDEAQDPVTQVEPVSPYTGGGQYTYWPAFAAILAGAALCLYDSLRHPSK